MEKIRYHLIDGWRGFLLLNMIAYHTLWDMVFMFGIDIPWYTDTPGRIWQRFICISFILLSGFCFHFGSSGLRRGLTVFLSGFLVTAVTLVAMPNMPAMFGVLTLIGSCMLLAVPIHRLLNRLNPKVKIIFSALMLFTSLLFFCAFYYVNEGTVNLFFTTVKLPGFLYNNVFTAYLGFPHYSFASSDYFPLLPWVFLFFSGYFLHNLTKQLLCKIPLLRTNIPFLSFFGKNSLLIYLIHQPAIYLVLFIVM